jgi:transcriptional regulator with XRE-family HTH domain
MAKRTAKGRGAGARGPYKEIEDADKLGTGGIRLRQHRLAKFLTVEALAADAGVSTGTISGIENGRLGYSPDTLQALARALKTTVGALFDVDPRGDNGGEIWPLWGRATAHERQRILDHAKGVVGAKK